jgi:hypothetical protein
MRRCALKQAVSSRHVSASRQAPVSHTSAPAQGVASSQAGRSTQAPLAQNRPAGHWSSVVQPEGVSPAQRPCAHAPLGQSLSVSQGATQVNAAPQ